LTSHGIYDTIDLAYGKAVLAAARTYTPRLRFYHNPMPTGKHYFLGIGWHRVCISKNRAKQPVPGKTAPLGGFIISPFWGYCKRYFYFFDRCGGGVSPPRLARFLLGSRCHVDGHTVGTTLARPNRPCQSDVTVRVKEIKTLLRTGGIIGHFRDIAESVNLSDNLTVKRTLALDNALRDNH
jgi:hypothetical protein